MGKKKDEEDLRVEPVDGAPFSLQKISDKLAKENKNPSNTYVLVDNTGSGFVNDGNLLNITIEEREKQADYFLSLGIIDLPPYLKKYLDYMYEDDKPDVQAMYKYAKSNAEFKQIIGMVQLVGGSLNAARKAKANVRMFIEEPEARQHPKRERRMMALIEMLKKDYGFKSEDVKKEK